MQVILQDTQLLDNRTSAPGKTQQAWQEAYSSKPGCGLPGNGGGRACQAHRWLRSPVFRLCSGFLICFVVLGIEPSSFTLSYIPALYLFFLLMWGLTKSLSCPGWTPICSHPTSSSQRAEVTACTTTPDLQCCDNCWNPRETKQLCLCPQLLQGMAGLGISALLSKLGVEKDRNNCWLTTTTLC